MASLANAMPSPTARLQFARLTQADAERLQALTNDPSITSAVHFLPSPFELTDAQRLIERVGENEAFLGIEERPNGPLVGIAGAHLHGGDQIEIGYWIGRFWQGKGYAAEAAAAVIAMLQSMFPARQIVAECRSDNIASWKTLERLGFRSTGKKGRRPGRDLLAL